jgi:membrane-bound ClpP family serine protease
MKKIITAAILISFLLFPHSAKSEEIVQPDHVAKFRIEKEVGIINLQGEIDADSADQTVAAFKSFNEHHIDLVLVHLHSLGGKLGPGKEIINQILVARKHHIQVITLVDHHEYCVSMCTGIYAVGGSRIVAPDTLWGFHSPKIKMTDEEQNNPVKRKELEDSVKYAKSYMLEVYAMADRDWTNKVLKKYVMNEDMGMLILSGDDILQLKDNTWFTGIVGD